MVNAGVLDSEAGGPLWRSWPGASARKVAYIERRGRAAVVFRHGWEWVSVEGPAHVAGPDQVDPERLAALLRAIFIAAGGTHDDWATFDRAMVDEGRVAVLVEPRRITGNS